MTQVASAQRCELSGRVHLPVWAQGRLNQWVIDDATGHLRQRFASTSGGGSASPWSELSLGHIIGQGATSAQRGPWLGSGFCAHTDGWASVHLGKVSKGGSDPKTPGVLYKLGDGSNGTGIDAVWHVSTRNQGKPYAVVEAKSDFEVKQPAFIKRNPSTGKKPGVTAKLGVSGVPKLDEMLEPHIGAAIQNGGKPGGGKPTGGGGASKAKVASRPATASGAKSGPIVQMSREWVRANIDRAVGAVVAADFKRKGYSRHLIYTPMWLPAMALHATAVATGTTDKESSHRDHDVLPNLHYEDAEVTTAVNKKKNNLRARFPSATTLNAET